MPKVMMNSNNKQGSNKQQLPLVKLGTIPLIESTRSITSVANIRVLVLPNGILLTKRHYIGYVQSSAMYWNIGRSPNNPRELPL